MNNKIRLLIFIPLMAVLVYAGPKGLTSQPSPTSRSQQRVAKAAKRQSAKDNLVQGIAAKYDPLTECKNDQGHSIGTPTYWVAANSTGVADVSKRVYVDGLIIPDDKDLKSPEVKGLEEWILSKREDGRNTAKKEIQGLIEAKTRGSINEMDFQLLAGRFYRYLEFMNYSSWAQLSKFDWREKGLDVGPVMNQGQCGSCWAFAAAEVYQCAWDLEQKRLVINYYQGEGMQDYRYASVQQLLNCVSKSKGDCRSGWHGSAFDFMVTSHVPHTPDRKVVKSIRTGVPIEEYTGRKSKCISSFINKKLKRGGELMRIYLNSEGGPPILLPNSDRIETAFDRPLMWGYVNEQAPLQMPTVEQLKAALVEHGPLAVTINANNCFTVYKGGVFNGYCTYSPNHVLMLIGWDDSKQAWLIKNSWGKKWGEQGFGWVEYGSNNIGYYAAWIQPSPELTPEEREQLISEQNKSDRPVPPTHKNKKRSKTTRKLNRR